MDQSLDYYTHRMIILAVAACALLAILAAYRLYFAIAPKGTLTKEANRRLNGRCAAGALLILIPMHAALVQYVAMRGLVPFVHLIHKIATKAQEAFDYSGFMHVNRDLQMGILALYLVELTLVVVAFLALGPAAHGDSPRSAVSWFWRKRHAIAAPTQEAVQ